MKTFSAIALSSALMVAACSPSNPPQQTGTQFSAGAQAIVTAEAIRVTAPPPNATITSPVIVSGEARGNWYFEASFPIEITDADGNQIAIVPAQAQGDWMTTDFVPFSVSIPFAAQPAGTTGWIILHLDNASGEPSRDASLKIPVKF